LGQDGPAGTPDVLLCHDLVLSSRPALCKPGRLSTSLRRPGRHANPAFQSFSLFLPSIIAGMGYTSTIAQLFTVPPNMLGFFVVIGTATLSDRVRSRGPFIIVGTIVGICGYIMLLASDQIAVKYAGTFFIGAGVFQASPMLMVRPLVSLSSNGSG